MPEQRFPHLWTSIYFWFVVLGVAAFKAITAPERTPVSMAMSAVVALFCAAAFTEGVVEWFKLGDTSLQYAVAGLVALTGEHAMQLVVTLARDPSKAIDLWHKLRRDGDAK